jgi:hypothetical protein
MRFDFLTTTVSIATFALCSGNYFFLQVHRPLGSVQEKVVFPLWALLVITGITVAFQTSLRSGAGRLAKAIR